MLMSDLALHKITLPDGVAAQIGGIRLVSGASGLELAYALSVPSSQPKGSLRDEVQLWTVPITSDGTSAGKPRLHASVLQLFPGVPAWDFDGKRWLYAQPGGGRNSIWLHDATGSRMVNGLDRLNGFDQPRLVRGSVPAREISALLDFPPRPRLALFSDVSAKCKLGMEASALCLLKHDHGFVALYKSDLSGALKGPLVFPGVLHHAWLQPDLTVDPIPSLPMPGVKIYELDALLHSGHLVSFITTDLGVVAHTGTSTATGIERPRTTLCTLQPTPSWPTITAHGDHLAFAVVAAANTPAAAVHFGRVTAPGFLK